MQKISRPKYLLQERFEKAFDKKLVFKQAYEELLRSEQISEIMDTKGVPLLTEYLYGEYFPMKQSRVDQVKLLDSKDLVYKVITSISLGIKPMPLVSVAAKCCGILKMADTVKSIQTMAEIISVLSHTGLFDLSKLSETPDASYMVIPKIMFSEELRSYITQTAYLPPMLHRPKKLRHNRSSGYLTQQGESLILGGFQNHHDWDICLDVLNIMNSNEYELDMDYLSKVEEPKPKQKKVDEAVVYITQEMKDAEKFAIENFEDYKKQCYFLYSYINWRGNLLHLNHKVDKRGRIYSCGYHINPQGASHKKAMINSKHKEIPTGIAEFLNA